MPDLHRLTWAKWKEVLNEQEHISPDAGFPNRPASGFFDLISRIVRACDELSETNFSLDLITEFVSMLGGVADDLEYLSEMRASMAVRRTLAISDPKLRRQVHATIQAAWLDGWTNGTLYGNENPIVDPATLDAEGEP